MKTEILSNIDNPGQLEKLYRENKVIFEREFKSIYPEHRENPYVQSWHERLNYENESISWGSAKELTIVIIISLIAGLIAKLPHLFSIDEEFFYSRNLGFIFLPMITVYFAWKKNMNLNYSIAVACTILISAFYINLLPAVSSSDTLTLACIHMPLFIWAVLGFSYSGNTIKNVLSRLNFLRYNGDLIVMTTVIVIAGAILSGVTIGLFSLIDIHMGEFYFQNVAIWGLAAAPVFGTYLVQTNPQLVNKVSPVIAKVFTPLVIIVLVIYLITVFATGKDPYTDREFLIVFNLMLIGVMAIILFSLAESSRKQSNRLEIITLLTLSILTILVNGIALSAIIFRISEWGITPNRLTVLGANILMLINVTIVAWKLIRTLQNKTQLAGVEKSIATYLPVYFIWTIIVVFVLPFAFNFK